MGDTGRAQSLGVRDPGKWSYVVSPHVAVSGCLLKSHPGRPSTCLTFRYTPPLFLVSIDKYNRHLSNPPVHAPFFLVS